MPSRAGGDRRYVVECGFVLVLRRHTKLCAFGLFGQRRATLPMIFAARYMHSHMSNIPRGPKQVSIRPEQLDSQLPPGLMLPVLLLHLAREVSVSMGNRGARAPPLTRSCWPEHVCIGTPICPDSVCSLQRTCSEQFACAGNTADGLFDLHVFRSRICHSQNKMKTTHGFYS